MRANDQDKDRGFRLEHSALSELLDRLDHQQAYGNHKEVRSSERYQYRAHKLILEVKHPNAEPTRYVAAARNISSTGAGLVVGQFVYPGSTCMVYLRSVHNTWQAIPAKVMRCRYIVGSRNVHEVGVRFDKAIDVAMFHRGARRVQVLVIDDDPTVRALLERFVAGTNVRVTAAETAAAGLELIQANEYELIFLDINLPDSDGISLVRQVREHEHLGPIVALTANDNRAECIEAGFTDFLAKPFNKSSVLEVIEQIVDEPLVSNLVHDADMAGMIDQFVRQLQKQIHEIERLFRDRDFGGLRDVLGTLKGQAGSYGFPVITDAARSAEGAAGDEPDLTQLRSALNELLRWCRAARPVNCVSEDDD